MTILSKICITPLLVCSLHLPKIIEFYIPGTHSNATSKLQLM